MPDETLPVHAAPAKQAPAVLAVVTAGIMLFAPDRPQRFALALAPRHQPRRVLYLGLAEEDALLLYQCLEEALTRPAPTRSAPRKEVP
jgi:hypothetical protein